MVKHTDKTEDKIEPIKTTFLFGTLVTWLDVERGQPEMVVVGHQSYHGKEYFRHYVVRKNNQTIEMCEGNDLKGMPDMAAKATKGA